MITILYQKKIFLTDNLKNIIKKDFHYIEEDFSETKKIFLYKIEKNKNYLKEKKKKLKFLKKIRLDNEFEDLEQNLFTLKNNFQNDMNNFAKSKSEKIDILELQLQKMSKFYNINMNSMITKKKINLTDSHIDNIINPNKMKNKLSDKKFEKVFDKIEESNFEFDSNFRRPTNLLEKCNFIQKNNFKKKKNDDFLKKSIVLNEAFGNKDKKYDSDFMKNQNENLNKIFKHKIFENLFDVENYKSSIFLITYLYYFFSSFEEDIKTKKKIFEFLNNFNIFFHTSLKDFKIYFLVFKEYENFINKFSDNKNLSDFILLIEKKFHTNLFLDKKKNMKNKKIYDILILNNLKEQIKNDTISYFGIEKILYIIFFYLGNFYISNHFSKSNNEKMQTIIAPEFFKENLKNFLKFFSNFLQNANIDNKNEIILFLDKSINYYEKIDIKIRYPFSVNLFEKMFEFLIGNILKKIPLYKFILPIRNFFSTLNPKFVDIEENSFFLIFFKLFFKKEIFFFYLQNKEIEKENLKTIKFFLTFFIKMQTKNKYINSSIFQELEDNIEFLFNSISIKNLTPEKIEVFIILFTITILFKKKKKQQ